MTFVIHHQIQVLFLLGKIGLFLFALVLSPISLICVWVYTQDYIKSVRK